MADEYKKKKLTTIHHQESANRNHGEISFHIHLNDHRGNTKKQIISASKDNEKLGLLYIADENVIGAVVKNI